MRCNRAPTLCCPHAPPLRGSLPPEGANFPWGGPAENCCPHAPPLRGSLPPEGANFPWGGPAENCCPHAPPLRGSLPPEGANFPWGGPAENCCPHAPPLRGSVDVPLRHCERSAAIHDFRPHGLPRRFAPRSDNFSSSQRNVNASSRGRQAVATHDFAPTWTATSLRSSQ